MADFTQALTATQGSNPLFVRSLTRVRLLFAASVSLLYSSNLIGKTLAATESITAVFVRSFVQKFNVTCAATISRILSISKYFTIQTATLLGITKHITIDSLSPALQGSAAVINNGLQKFLSVITVSQVIFSKLFVIKLPIIEQSTSAILSHVLGKILYCYSFCISVISKKISYLRIIFVENAVYSILFKSNIVLLSVVCVTVSTFSKYISKIVSVSSNVVSSVLKSSIVVLLAISVSLCRFSRDFTITIKAFIGNIATWIKNSPRVLLVTSPITTGINFAINKTVFVVTSVVLVSIVKSIQKNLVIISNVIIQDFRGATNNAVLNLKRTLTSISSITTGINKLLYKTLTGTRNTVCNILRKWG